MTKRFIPFLALLFSFTAQASECPATLKVGSLNLLTRYAPHAFFYAPWAERADGVATWVKQDGIELLGTQEGIASMVSDLEERLPEFQRVGVARSDSWFFAEFTAIFFNREKFELLDHGDFWLSETPDVPGSSSWGAANVRMCTWAKLKSRRDGKVIYAFNAHLDHVSEDARFHGAELILQRAAEIAGSHPLVFMGDLNTGESEPTLDLLSRQWKESRAHSLAAPKGPLETGPFGMRLDYIFTSPQINVCVHEVPQPLTAYGRDLSDHWPVSAVLSL